MATYRKCDRCGATTERGETFTATITTWMGYQRGALSERERDLCHSCNQAFTAWMLEPEVAAAAARRGGKERVE